MSTATAPTPAAPSWRSALRLYAVTLIRLVPLLFLGEVLASLARMALGLTSPIPVMLALYVALIGVSLLLARSRLRNLLPLAPIVSPRMGALVSVAAWITSTSIMSLVTPAPTTGDILTALLMTVLCLTLIGEIYGAHQRRASAVS